MRVEQLKSNLINYACNMVYFKCGGSIVLHENYLKMEMELACDESFWKRVESGIWTHDAMSKDVT